MSFDFLDRFPLWLILISVVTGAIAVWISGEKLSHYAGIIAERTGIGHAIIGAVLLGGITSLPEIATTVTASLIESAPIAVNNIIGGVSMQVAVLAIADIFAVKTALSFHISDPKVRIQAVLNIFLLTIVLTGILLSGTFQGFPFFTGLIFFIYLGSFILMKSVKSPSVTGDNEKKRKNSGISDSKLTWYTILASIVILAAGFVISVSGENIAHRTAFGENFIGAVLIAATTSLPELSTTISAVKEKNYNLAASNIFGSNLIILALLFVADLAYKEGSVLDKVKEFSEFGALLGIMVCSVYLTGFIAKKNKVFLNMGWDSLMVLLLYFSGLVILFFLK